ncbi:MAG: acyltransferase [Clostridium sp.]|jgi:fucose 4-O-acetylase-like acetyltransferase|nr:acyltransferase [Clostridium sp.]
METARKESSFIDVVKAFAILSVASAHCAPVPETASAAARFCGRLLESFGSFGVPVFLGLAGYLFCASLERQPWKELVKRKAVSLVIPWLFCGTLVYLYVVLRKGGLGIGSYLKFLLGGGSFLYYMSMLILCYVIYGFLRRSRLCVAVAFALSVSSFLLTVTGGLGRLGIGLNPYLNVANWLGYFLTGAWLYSCGEEKLRFLPRFLRKTWACFAVAVAGTVGIVAAGGGVVGYWSLPFLLAEPCAAAAVFGLALRLSSREDLPCRASIQYCLLYLGRRSFTLYLIHMPFAGVTANLLNRADLWWAVPFRPFLALGAAAALYECAARISRLVRMERTYGILTGRRERG